MNDLSLIATDREAFQNAVAKGLPYKPIYAKFKIVWNCNLRCGMCNHWRDSVQPPLDLEFFKPIIDELAAWGCKKIHLTGGEATLRPNLEAFIAYISAQDIRVTMTTNATLLTPERAYHLTQAGLKKVNISLDSPNSQIHDRIRGIQGAWKRAISGFQALRPYLKPGKMRINTVIGRLNYASLKSLPDLAAELGADSLNLIPLDQHTPDLSRMNVGQILDYNLRIAPSFARKALTLGLLKTADQAYPFGQTFAEIRQSQQGNYAKTFYHQHRCFAPWTHVLINHVGQVSICCMMPNQPIIGDLRQQSFTEIWTGEVYRKLRQTQQLPQFAACGQCDMFLAENRSLNQLLRSV